MSIFPEIVSELEEVTMDTELPMLKEYAYNFETNELKLKNGKHYLVEGNEALKIWIYKALRTERYRYMAYSDDYGTEIYTVIGTVLSTPAKKAEIKRFVTETLMVNPYIVSIEKIALEQMGSVLQISVTVKSIYEDEVVAVKCSTEIV